MMAMSSRLVRKFAGWIALVALLAVTFMPTITSALSVQGDRIDICSATTPRNPGTDNGHHVLDHCPYCALHADLALPVLPPTSAANTAARFRELPEAFLKAPRATGVWSTSQPRGPPAFV